MFELGIQKLQIGLPNRHVFLLCSVTYTCVKNGI